MLLLHLNLIYIVLAVQELHTLTQFLLLVDVVGFDGSERIWSTLRIPTTIGQTDMYPALF